jgi:hypothetical protein
MIYLLNACKPHPNPSPKERELEDCSVKAPYSSNELYFNVSLWSSLRSPRFPSPLERIGEVKLVFQDRNV